MASLCNSLILLLLLLWLTTVHMRLMSSLVSASYYPGGNPQQTGWRDAHATLYGGSDASGTMGGACSYGDLYTSGYGTSTAPPSAQPSSTVASAAEPASNSAATQPQTPSGASLGHPSPSPAQTSALPTMPSPTTQAAGNPPLEHFDMAQPAFEKIGIYRGGVVPVQYRRVPCTKAGGIHFTINGHSFFNLVLITNVGDVGDVHAISMKGSRTGWQPMSRNWGQNWQSNANLDGQSLSFQVTTSDGRTLTSYDVAPADWRFGQTFSGEQF